MPDLPTFDDFFDIGVQAITGVPGTRLTEEAARLVGSDLNILISAAALMAERCAQDAVAIQAALTLDGAQGAELDVLGFDLPYSTPRLAASPAVADVSITRPNAAAGAGTVPAQTRMSIGGIPFRTSVEAAFAAAGATSTTVTVRAQAETTGPTGNVAAATQGVFTDAVFDPTLVPTTATAAAGGSDSEPDASYRERLRQAPAAARRGTLQAIEFGARSVLGVAFATATERLNPDGSPAHIVDLVVADAQGNGNAALSYLVGLAIESYRCGGIPVTVAAGVPSFVEIAVTLTYISGTDTVYARTAAISRIVAAVNALAPGATLHLSAITAAAIGGGTGATGVVSCAVTVPTGDIAAASLTTVIRTSTALVTA